MTVMNDRAPDRIFRYVPHDDVASYEAAGWRVIPARIPHRVMDCYRVLARGVKGASITRGSRP